MNLEHSSILKKGAKANDYDRLTKLVTVDAKKGDWPALEFSFRIDASHGESDHRIHIRAADFPTVLEAMSKVMRAQAEKET